MSSLKISVDSDHMDAEITIKNPSDSLVKWLFNTIIETEDLNNESIVVESPKTAIQNCEEVEIEVLTGECRDPAKFLKINLIKIVRTETGYPLKEAKELVETTNSFKFPYSFDYRTKDDREHVSNLIKQIADCNVPVRVLKVGQ